MSAPEVRSPEESSDVWANSREEDSWTEEEDSWTEEDSSPALLDSWANERDSQELKSADY